MEYVLSKHAQDRIKERMGLGKKAQRTLLEKAINRGTEHGNTKGSLYKWVTARLLQHSPKGTKAVIYSNNLFLYQTREDTITLITIIPVPANLQHPQYLRRK